MSQEGKVQDDKPLIAQVSDLFENIGRLEQEKQMMRADVVRNIEKLAPSCMPEVEDSFATAFGVYRVNDHTIAKQLLRRTLRFSSDPDEPSSKDRMFERACATWYIMRRQVRSFRSAERVLFTRLGADGLRIVYHVSAMPTGYLLKTFLAKSHLPQGYEWYAYGNLFVLLAPPEMLPPTPPLYMNQHVIDVFSGIIAANPAIKMKKTVLTDLSRIEESAPTLMELTYLYAPALTELVAEDEEEKGEEEERA
nr:MAG: hypothetical protein [Apis mellifra filamentous-like virus]